MTIDLDKKTGFLKRVKFFMRVMLIHCIMTACFYTASGQHQIIINEPGNIDATTGPLVCVDTLRTYMKYLDLDPQKIDSVNIFKDSLAISKFGEAGKNGVILIHPKKFTVFYRLHQVLDQYKIPAEKRSLGICLDKTLLAEPWFLLIESSGIEDVKITTDWHWINATDSNSGKQVINIGTKNPIITKG
jgi:hypothetical protein